MFSYFSVSSKIYAEKEASCTDQGRGQRSHWFIDGMKTCPSFVLHADFGSKRKAEKNEGALITFIDNLKFEYLSNEIISLLALEFLLALNDTIKKKPC